MRERLMLAMFLAVACAGCSWLIGVSEDPVVVEYGQEAGLEDRALPRDGMSGSDAAPADDSATDAAEDAPNDAEEDV